MPESRPLKPYPLTPPPQLLADIGGTHTRLALADAGVLRPGSLRRYRNGEYDAFAALLADYMHACAVVECAGACFAVAGPVREGTVRLTNLGWELSHDAIAAQTGSIVVYFLNDLQAQGHALDAFGAGHSQTLVGAPSAQGAMTRLVVGIGTGFNAAPVHRHAEGLFVPASECGHVHLPRKDDDEQALANWLADQNAIATVEEALSGRGLMAIHRFLGHGEATPEAIIADIVAKKPAACETGALYTKLLARVLGDLALIHLPYGGIWLIGGLARAIGPHLAGFGLPGHFHALSRGGIRMQDFALHLIDDDYAALTGCAAWLKARSR